MEPETETQEDFLATEDGFKPISVYNIAFPQEAILVEDNQREPDLAKYAKFDAGVYLCMSPSVKEALSKFTYLYWENLPAGREARKCPHCGWSARNDDAVWAHVATHSVDGA